MYTILLDNDKTLVCTHRETIMQRSKLCDRLLFLVPMELGGYDAGEFEVNLEYVLPVSRKYVSVLLTKQDKLYDDKYYQYILEADTDITAENGAVEMQLSFINITTGNEGEIKTVVFKTQACKVHITPLTDWAQYVSDTDLTKIDQRITEITAAQKALAYTQEELSRAQEGLIDDEHISDRTTYSSKKIEERYYDETKVNNSEIDEMFNGGAPSDEDYLNRAIDELFNDADETVGNEEIDEMFDKDGDINTDIENLFNE